MKMCSSKGCHVNELTQQEENHENCHGAVTLMEDAYRSVPAKVVNVHSVLFCLVFNCPDIFDQESLGSDHCLLEIISSL